MSPSTFQWGRRHAMFVGLLTVGGLLAVANAFRTQPALADESYDGQVMSVADQSLMIQTAPDSDARSFEVARDAKITKDGEKVSLDHLSMGDHVTVAVAVRDSQEVATSIVAKSPL